jgi:hypothetical protein
LFTAIILETVILFLVPKGFFAVPTPGARAILNTFAREKQEAEKKAAGPDAVEKSAKDLLREHGRAVARAEKPVLGWGMQAGNSTISLDVSPAQACFL